MTETRQLLPIRSKYRGPIFRAIEDVLRSDDVLSAVVKTWRSRQGLDDDLAMPGFDGYPMIALTPIPHPNTVIGENATKINFEVGVQMWVPGSCVEDIFALWEAVEDAVVGEKTFRDTTVERYLACAFGLNRGIIRLAAAAPAFVAAYPGMRLPDGTAAVTQAGLGSLSCFANRPA